MPAAAAAAAAAQPGPAAGPEDLDDEPPEEPRPRGPNTRGSGLMKPFVVLALPGMYLFYKYSQYRREQREASRRRVTERELQHLHHKIDKLLTKLEENEPEMASSQEDEHGHHSTTPRTGTFRVAQMSGGMNGQMDGGASGHAGASGGGYAGGQVSGQVDGQVGAQMGGNMHGEGGGQMG